MNSTDEVTKVLKKKLKDLTKEVYLIANVSIKCREQDVTTALRLLRKIQKEKDVLAKKLEKAKSDSK